MQAPSGHSFLILRSKLRSVGVHRLVAGRAALYHSHIRLSGWSLRGRYDRRIGLDDVEWVEWYVDEIPRVMLGLRHGEQLSLAVRGAALWRLTLDDLRGPAHRPQPAERQRSRYRHQVLYAGESWMGGDGMEVSPVAVAARTDRT